jgi:hypothetical protein
VIPPQPAKLSRRIKHMPAAEAVPGVLEWEKFADACANAESIRDRRKGSGCQVAARNEKDEG